MKKYHTTFPAENIDPSVFIAAGAVVIGDVYIWEKASVWFNAVLRGDTETLNIGPGANIQDGAICHADPGLPLNIGTGTSVGHGAIVHGARIGKHSLVGMGAIIMNGALIGDYSIVGAGALVTEGVTFPHNSLILGSPAKAIRQVTDEEIAMIRRTAANYIDKAQAFRSNA